MKFDNFVRVTSATVGSKMLWGPVLAFFLFAYFGLRAENIAKLPSPQTTLDQQCIDNLRTIYRLLKLHLHHSAGALGFPTNFDLLYDMSKDPRIFLCPTDKQPSPAEQGTFPTSYEIVKDPLIPSLSKTPPRDIAIIAEKRPTHNGRRFVLFYDGSVRAFDDRQFEILKGNSFIDKATMDKTRTP